MTAPSESGASRTHKLSRKRSPVPAANPAAAASSHSLMEHLRLRAELMDAVRGVIRRQGLRQQDAADLFGVAQPRVSDLVRGKIALFSIDTLVDMLAAAGVTVELKLRTARAGAPAPARTRGAEPDASE
jgi:predicted XRE-type DNA-binding protein